jgi:hypothetical protein
VARRPARRKAKRTYHRDARGRFAPAPNAAEAQKKRKRRRRAAGAVVVAGAVAGSQVHPTSRTRTGLARRRIVRGHIERARADHERLASIRARAFPTSVMTARPFNAKAARAEVRKLTKGYRKGVKSVRKAARRTRR